ncbi:MAG: hypothetical protein Q9217_006046 [Psora testacea]
MSFRKRNVGLAGSPSVSPKGINTTQPSLPPSPGIRPSPLDGRLTTSTGIQTLDDLLAGHAGFPLGNSILIEENGTTDFAGALLRYYAAEGVVQGHYVHVVGMPEQWGRELPGLIGDVDGQKPHEATSEGLGSERMKIAWRYQRLGEFGASSRAPIPNRNPVTASSSTAKLDLPASFCHTFDLTKRLAQKPSPLINYVPIPVAADLNKSPFDSILVALSGAIFNAPQNAIHRLIIPSLLSPALYPWHASDPTYLLRFLHKLRGLLRRSPQQATAMITLPLSLHPRNTGLVRWAEHLMDGILEISPFPHSIDMAPTLTMASADSSRSKAEERPQGMVKIHKLPVLTDKGGGSGAGDDLAFSLSRKRFIITPFHLPPMEGDREAQRGELDGVELGKEIEF